MKYFFYAIISGLLFGLGTVVMKILLEGREFFLIIFEPLFLFSGIFGIVALLLNQIALKNMKSSHVSLLTTVMMTIVSIIGGIFLGEAINAYELIGIMLMMFSIIFILSKK